MENNGDSSKSALSSVRKLPREANRNLSPAQIEVSALSPSGNEWGRREPAAHFYRLQLSFTVQKILGTFISKITAEHYSLNICLCMDFEMPRVLKQPELPALICCLINRRIQPFPRLHSWPAFMITFHCEESDLGIEPKKQEPS